MRMEGGNYLEGIHKTKNIRAFDRLIQLTVEKQWRGNRLDDRTEEGLATCLKTWFQLNMIHAVQKGNIVDADIDDLGFTFLVSFDSKSVIDSEGIIVIKSISQFMSWWDDNNI